MSDDPVLRQRLVGAATVFGIVLLLAWLVPPPGEEESTGNGHVVIRLDAPAAGAPRTETDGRGSADKPALAGSAPAPLAEPEQAPASPEPEAAPEPPESPDPAPTATAPEPPPESGQWWIQAATYSDRDVAQRGRERVRSELDSGSRLREARIDGRVLWRLQVGPLASAEDAEALAKQLDDAGFSGARVFRDSGD